MQDCAPIQPTAGHINSGQKTTVCFLSEFLTIIGSCLIRDLPLQAIG